ncbi:OLC1v1010494C1 [Oldenlandia corymbosa var. corymbosa]|uniref:protein-serine/threonine phosphatase n=1 Tax=Oldenlandia corymbosa var. corymbosa TaxID=529605 RepID=A0AAV1DRG3_OLDCO|nr:OLC1v1010494C1 [Oldenlandia corymbosa var. corymbosa]
MAPGTSGAPHHGELNDGFSKDKASINENEVHEPDMDDQNMAKLGKPPRNLPLMRHCISHAMLAGTSVLDLPNGAVGREQSGESSGFSPVFRSGSCSEKGPKQYMEDEFICIDNLREHLSEASKVHSSGAFYGVFDGHGGIDAASFTKRNILEFIVEDSYFPSSIKRAIRNAFVKADHALADASSLDRTSGTTVITALVLGRTMLVANAGDSRAVLGKRGRAVELSRDHKPNSTSEKIRIEKLGGTIYDGYLNGQLSVSRALGDWHLKGQKGANFPLSSEPEMEEVVLTEEDEFLIIGCDGLWDVMSSQCAVTITRKELMLHNDPEKCSKELVREALKRNSCDNLTVVVVCFSPDPPRRIEIPKTQRRRSISAEGLDLLKGVLSSNV